MTENNLRNRMRVLHLIPLHEPSVGIVRQAVWEQSAAKENGLDWKTKIFTFANLSEDAEELRCESHFPTTTRISLRKVTKLSMVRQKFEHRRHLYQWLNTFQDDYDLILLRHTYSDLQRARHLRSLRTPVLTVHHTLEIPEMQLSTGLFGKARELTERFSGPRSIRASAGIVGVTPEIASYELARSRASLPTFTMPNGVDINHHTIFADLRGDSPEILFVASEFYPWHGLDLLIDAVEVSDENFTIHIVGDCSDVDRARMSQDSRFKCHGRLSQGEISNIASRSWLGLSSFALFRKRMHEACTLKVREYLAGGLPTYANHRDVFPEGSLCFQEGPADMSTILNAAWSRRNVSREEIRKESLSFISKEAILRGLYQELEESFGKIGCT